MLSGYLPELGEYMKNLTKHLLYKGTDIGRQNVVWNIAGSFVYALASMVLSFLVIRVVGDGLPEYTNDRQIAAAAERTGLLLMPGNTFFAEGSHGESYIRVSYSSVTDEEIAEGCRRMAEVLNSCRI